MILTVTMKIQPGENAKQVLARVLSQLNTFADIDSPLLEGDEMFLFDEKGGSAGTVEVR